MSEEEYYTIKQAVRAKTAAGACRFIGSAAPVSFEEEALRFIQAVREEFPDATHHAYVYVLGSGPARIERVNDDREPAGSAGLPMLQAVNGAGLTDVVVVATRYFGGVKLGIGGLTRAYRSCAKACLDEAEIVRKIHRQVYTAVVPYPDLGAVLKHIESCGGVIIAIEYMDEVTVRAGIPVSREAALREGITELTRGRGRLEAVEGGAGD